jgi:hypothetical protein
MAVLATLQFDVATDVTTPHVVLIYNDDGSIEFTDLHGNKVVAHSNPELSKLADKIRKVLEPSYPVPPAY